MSENFWAMKGSIHWQTPREILDLVDQVFPHGVGLDPCAAQYTSIGITNWRLADGNDALACYWSEIMTTYGNPWTFFINPPFGTSYVKDKMCISAKQFKDMNDDIDVPLEHKQGWVRQTIQQFAHKVASEVEQGMSGIWLSKGSMETKSIQKLMNVPGTLVCHPDHRINYKDPVTGKVAKGVNFNSTILCLLGAPDYQNAQIKDSFCTHFSKIGTILTKV